MIKNIIRYLRNELSHKLKKGGDTRCEFQKAVERARHLESSRIINNPGECSNPNHQH